MPTARYACVFVRPSRERLVAAERLVGALPSYLAGAEGECDLHHHGASGYLAAILRASPAAFTPEVVARLTFWAARCGARGFLVGALHGDQAARFEAELKRCDRVVRGTSLAAFGPVAGRFLRELGAPVGGGPPGAPPVLGVDLDGPGGAGVQYRPETRGLFVAGVLAPPLGDSLAIAVRDRRVSRPVEGWVSVVGVRGREQAGPGKPAGFTLRVEGPAALHELLATRARQEVPRPDARAAPRFPVKAPVTVKPARAATPHARAALPRARIEYASDEELAADWIENLSQGGALVRTATPAPVGTAIVLELALPEGERLTAHAVVVFTGPRGMGVRFALTPEQDALLAAAIARISGRPRRALVVDDDVLVRRMLVDALAARGFEVLTAPDGATGLRVLSEELLALDLLVTDVRMPGLDGEAFIRTIREAGGEADLAIVVVSGAIQPGAERGLEDAGADAVLDKALGPEMVAQGADAALERKRLVARQADAA